MTDIEFDDADETFFADVPGPFRDGKVHVLSAKCATCIFRPGNLMHLREGALELMVEECKEKNLTVPCHDTIIDGPKAICRGFYDVHRQDVLPLRLAEALEVVVFEEPPILED